MTIENIKELMDGVDIAALLPDIQSIVENAHTIARYAVLLGPAVLLFLGLHYLLLAPKEANYTTGYRFYWGMSSVEAWRFTQRLAGAIWSILGLGLLVVMVVRGRDYAEMQTMELLWEAVGCLAVQVAALLVSCGIINVTVFIRFDRKGNRRLTWRELYQA